MKHLYFLAGIPRSGSTVLANILNQHPDIYVSPSSGLLDMICFTEQNLLKLEKHYTLDPQQRKNIIQGVIDSYYAHKEEGIILDKHRGWPRNLPAVSDYVSDLKVIVTIRPIADAVTSMIKLIVNNEKKYKKKNNNIDEFLRSKSLAINTHNRAKAIFHQFWQGPYENVKSGIRFEKESTEKGVGKILHFVHYDELISDPENVLAGITAFLGLDETYSFNLNKIGNKLREKDGTHWNMPGLHNVRPRLSKQSWDPHKTLGSDLVAYFSKYDFNLPSPQPQ